MQVVMGLGDPDLSQMPQLRQVLKGIRESLPNLSSP